MAAMAATAGESHVFGAAATATAVVATTAGESHVQPIAAWGTHERSTVAGENSIPAVADEKTDGGISKGENFTGSRLLLVDDVEINREIVITLLEPTGIEIDSAENGAIAVRMFAENPEYYDIVFMDVQMPEMDGYQATRTIRAMNAAKAKTIPIIAMTANVFKEDVKQSFSAGMNDHIGKPLDFDEVLSKLDKYLKGGMFYKPG